MKKILCIVFSATLIFVMSCQREQDVFETIPRPTLGDAKTTTATNHYGKITDRDLDNLHEKVSAFSEVLEAMYADEKVVNEVNQSISADFYSDESIVLKDLISPEASPLFKNARLKASGNFKEAFQKEYTKQLGSNPRLRDGK